MKRRLLIGWTALLASIVAPALAHAQNLWGKIIRGANIKLD